MQTDIVLAYTLEGGDVIIGEGEEMFTVLDLEDDADLLVFRVEDDFGDRSDTQALQGRRKSPFSD